MKNIWLYFLLFVLYFFWIQTQTWLSTVQSNNAIKDRIHDSKLVNQTIHFLTKNKNISSILIASTTFLIDSTLTILIIKSLLHNQIRYPIILLLGIILRQFCQYISTLPMPQGMIWHDPGFPTLYMVYDVKNDFFFSGHTFIAMLIGMELIEKYNFIGKIYGVFFIICQIGFVLITRSHYFIDVYAAITTYFTLQYLYNIFEKI